MKTIGLCMIVKNESRVILRCLESVRCLADYVLIEDTGSTDGTQAIVWEWLDRNGLPGEVYDAGWRDFASNRSHALQRLRERESIDYALIMDADDQLAIEAGFDAAAFKSAMNVELYDVQIRHGSIRYTRPQLCSNRLPFSYKGVLHEYLEGPEGGCSRATAQGFHIESGRDGARSGNPRKYEDDAAVLENALRCETDPFLISRYKFYLAQSYRDCGQSEKALKAYLERAELGFWDQEVFVSLYNAAKLQEALGRPFDEVIATYRRASNVVSNRAEALHGASRFCRLNDRFAEGRDYARRGLEIALPAGGLFVEPEVYEWRLLDEFAVNAYWVERYQECLDACLKLLSDGKLSGDQSPRVRQNANFAGQKLAALLEKVTLNTPEPQRSNISPSKKLPDFNICHISINIHGAIFDDIIRSLHGSLVDLGYTCSVKKNALERGAVNIVVGSIAFASRSQELSGFLQGHPFILYQLEQLSDDHGHFKTIPEYATILESASHILEYSPSGMNVLSRKPWFAKTTFLPPSFHRSLETFRPAEDRDIDVLFYGSHSVRRDRVVSELRSRGLHVTHLFGCYGDVLRQHIQRSKIVLNVHASPELNALETVRISYLLANRCFIVSETSDHNPYGTGVVFSDYDELANTCLAYLTDKSNQRDVVAAEGYVMLRRSDMVSDLRQAVGRMRLQQLVFAHEAPADSSADPRSCAPSNELATTDTAPQRLLAVGDPGQPSPAMNAAPGPDVAMLQQIHLINLDRSTDRWAKFKQRNPHPENIFRVSAADGASLNREELVRLGAITEDLSYPPGALGCALSHVGLWKKADTQNRIVTIFEDDTICSLDFLAESNRIVSLLPKDWDIIHWGYNSNPAFLWLDFGFSKAKLQFYDRRPWGEYRKFENGSLGSIPVRVAHCFGLFGYSVSPKGARALLECCVPLRKRLIPFPGTGVVINNEGIDCLMCAAYPSMQAFVCIPPLVVHDDAQTSDRVATDRKIAQVA